MSQTKWLSALSSSGPTDFDRLDATVSRLSSDELVKMAEEVGLAPPTLEIERFLLRAQVADQLGRDMALEQPLEKQALAFSPLMQKAVGFAARNPGKAMGLAGAGLGAGAGAIKGLVAPGRDANGNQQSRIGSALKGMAGGAVIGGALGAGVSKIPVGGGANVGSALRRAALGKNSVFNPEIAGALRNSVRATKATGSVPISAAPKGHWNGGAMPAKPAAPGATGAPSVTYPALNKPAPAPKPVRPIPGPATGTDAAGMKLRSQQIVQSDANHFTDFSPRAQRLRTEMRAAGQIKQAGVLGRLIGGSFTGGLHGAIAGAIAGEKGHRTDAALRGAAAGAGVGALGNAAFGSRALSNPILFNTAMGTAVGGASAAAGAEKGKRLKAGLIGGAISAIPSAGVGMLSSASQKMLAKELGHRLTAADTVDIQKALDNLREQVISRPTGAHSVTTTPLNMSVDELRQRLAAGLPIEI